MENNQNKYHRQYQEQNYSDYDEYQNDGQKPTKHDLFQQRLPLFNSQYILSNKVLKEMQKQKKIHQIKIHHQNGNYTFFFPHQNLHQPQKTIITDISRSLQRKQARHVLAESSTGTGKTLSLLISTLEWADNQYHKSVAKYYQQLNKLKLKKYSKQISQDQYRKRVLEQVLQIKKYKIIYSSRAHSQLSQIQKQLLKTPYRPKMLIFGSKKQMCIHQMNNKQIKNIKNKTDDDWHLKCNKSIKAQRAYQRNKIKYYKALKQRKQQLLNLFKNLDQIHGKNIDFKIQTNQTLESVISQIYHYLNNRYFFTQRNIDELSEVEKAKQQKINQFIDKEMEKQKQLNQKNKNYNKQQAANPFSKKNIKNQIHPQYIKAMYWTFQYIQLFINSKIPLNDRRQLLNALNKVKYLQARCTHYHSWDQRIVNRKFYASLGRQALNMKQFKIKALKNDPTVCAYQVPKTVKYNGTLYLMPYNYLLDENIMNSSRQLFENAIIIFDEGHNVPKAACQGFQSQMSEKAFQNTINNILQKDNKDQEDQLIDFDQLQKQKIMEQAEKNTKKIANNNKKNYFIQQQQLMDSSQSSIQEQSSNQSQKQKIKQKINQCIQIIKKQQNNFKKYFQQLKKDFKSTLEFKDQNISQFRLEQKQLYFGYNQKKVKYQHTSFNVHIRNYLKQIFFVQENTNKINQRIRFIIQILSQVVEIKKLQNKFYFKIIKFRNFYQKMLNLLQNKSYQKKFYLELSQYAKFNNKQLKLRYFGIVQIKCIDPGFAFNKLNLFLPRSIIIASGTLTPIQVFKQQIGLPQLSVSEGGQVIKDDNVLVRTVSTDLNGNGLQILNGFFHLIENFNRMIQLLIKIIQKIPKGGVLVVLPTFSAVQSVQKFFNDIKSAQIKKKIFKLKKYVQFEKKNSNIDQIMQKLKKNASKQGALIFCVVRAKLSQGIDFKDDLCRSVIFMGMPLLPSDPFVLEKTKFLEQVKRSRYFKQWRYIQVSKAINQALGRVVRHQNDYGSIILIDQRYQILKGYSQTVVRYISEWIMKRKKHSVNIKQLRQDLQKFYRIASEKFKDKQLKNQSDDSSQQQNPQYFRSRANQQILDNNNTENMQNEIQFQRRTQNQQKIYLQTLNDMRNYQDEYENYQFNEDSQMINNNNTMKNEYKNQTENNQNIIQIPIQNKQQLKLQLSKKLIGQVISLTCQFQIPDHNNGSIQRLCQALGAKIQDRKTLNTTNILLLGKTVKYSNSKNAAKTPATSQKGINALKNNKIKIIQNENFEKFFIDRTGKTFHELYQLFFNS